YRSTASAVFASATWRTVASCPASPRAAGRRLAAVGLAECSCTACAGNSAIKPRREKAGRSGRRPSCIGRGGTRRAATAGAGRQPGEQQGSGAVTTASLREDRPFPYGRRLGE